MENEINNAKRDVKSEKAAKKINRELMLKEKIEKAKAEIARLREKRIQECGKLAVKHKLHLVEDRALADCFKRLSKELGL